MVSKQGKCRLCITNCPLHSTYSHPICLPDDGKLHKAINANDKMHIIEEIILFPEPQPVQHIELDPQRVNHNSIITSLMQKLVKIHLCQCTSVRIVVIVNISLNLMFCHLTYLIM